MNRKDFLQKLYIEKDVTSLSAMFESGDLSLHFYAETLFEMSNYSQSANFYKKLGNFYKEGYCYLHDGKLEKAYLLWSTLQDESAPLLWGKALLSIFKIGKSNPPTYMQIRNFAEVDLGLFLKNKKFELVHKMIAAIKALEKINPEIHKYIGASLLNAGYALNSVQFLEHWKEISFKDPEIHILLARCYNKLNLPQKEQQALEDCLKIAPDYFPAKKLLGV